MTLCVASSAEMFELSDIRSIMLENESVMIQPDETDKTGTP